MNRREGDAVREVVPRDPVNPRDQINPRGQINSRDSESGNPREPLPRRSPRGAGCSANRSRAAAPGRADARTGSGFTAPADFWGPLPGTALRPTATVRPRGSPGSFSLGVPREIGRGPEIAGRHRGFWGHPRLAWNGAERHPPGHRERRPPYAGTPRGGEGRGETAGLERVPPGWPCPRGVGSWLLALAGLVAFLLRAGGVEHRGHCPTHGPQIALHSPGRALHEYPSTPGCPGVSSRSWCCWSWQPPGSGLCTELFTGFCCRLRGFGEGMAIRPCKNGLFQPPVPRFSAPPCGAGGSGHRGRSKAASAEPVHGGALKIP